MTLADRAAQPDATERVLDAVAAIPRGQVRSYGQVGATTGVGARQVGRILAVLGEQVPWWRHHHDPAGGGTTTAGAGGRRAGAGRRGASRCGRKNPLLTCQFFSFGSADVRQLAYCLQGTEADPDSCNLNCTTSRRVAIERHGS